MTRPRVTFGTIVLNGEPFVRYHLRALYPFAHQIIVVEGAAPAAANIATADGHSTDGTLQSLHSFKQFEDHENKVVIITAEDEGHPDGFWPKAKDEQSQAYARRATGDYLWQVDIDEFYMPQDIQTIFELLEHDPTITAMSFKQIQFWGGFDYVVDSWYLRWGGEVFHRLFRWNPGYSYTAHRPPTVTNGEGIDTRSIHWISADEMERRGVYLYHYSLLLPRQVIEKSEYYGNVPWAERSRSQEWSQDVFFGLKDPFRVHNVYDYPGWLERFTGHHPPAIKALRADLQSGLLGIALRQTDDIERLLGSRAYQLGRWVLRALTPWGRYLSFHIWRNRFRLLFRSPLSYLAHVGRRLSFTRAEPKRPTSNR